MACFEGKLGLRKSATTASRFDFNATQLFETLTEFPYGDPVTISSEEPVVGCGSQNLPGFELQVKHTTGTVKENVLHLLPATVVRPNSLAVANVFHFDPAALFREDLGPFREAQTPRGHHVHGERRVHTALEQLRLQVGAVHLRRLTPREEVVEERDAHVIVLHTLLQQLLPDAGQHLALRRELACSRLLGERNADGVKQRAELVQARRVEHLDRAPGAVRVELLDGLDAVLLGLLDGLHFELVEQLRKRFVARRGANVLHDAAHARHGLAHHRAVVALEEAQREGVERHARLTPLLTLPLLPRVVLVERRVLRQLVHLLHHLHRDLPRHDDVARVVEPQLVVALARPRVAPRGGLVVGALGVQRREQPEAVRQVRRDEMVPNDGVEVREAARNSNARLCVHHRAVILAVLREQRAVLQQLLQRLQHSNLRGAREVFDPLGPLKDLVVVAGAAQQRHADGSLAVVESNATQVALQDVPAVGLDVEGHLLAVHRAQDGLHRSCIGSKDDHLALVHPLRFPLPTGDAGSPLNPQLDEPGEFQVLLHDAVGVQRRDDEHHFSVTSAIASATSR